MTVKAGLSHGSTPKGPESRFGGGLYGLRMNRIGLACPRLKI
jgi:hypothetical protein